MVQTYEIIKKSDTDEIKAFDINSLWHVEEYAIYSRDKMLCMIVIPSG